MLGNARVVQHRSEDPPACAARRATAQLIFSTEVVGELPFDSRCCVRRGVTSAVRSTTASDHSSTDATTSTPSDSRGTMQPTRPIVFEADDFVVFELGGALLALFPLDKLGADNRAQPEPRHGGIRSSIIVNVEAPEHVDELQTASLGPAAR